ncbi:MAG: cytochrome c biogenesis protein CcdA [Eubacteriales bacterium]|nr:cytochrome c biogenesis protein CcdA [Eubacteriales bacterium]
MFFKLPLVLQMLSTDESLSFAAVFIAGLLAFFSPCVLPIVPLYMGYLSGSVDGDEIDQSDAEAVRRLERKQKRKTMLNTLAFVLGISFVYLLLAFAASSFGNWFSRHGNTISRIGGAIILVLGVLQLISQLRGKSIGRERRISFNLDKYAMNPLIAFLLGFSFSFAWTPCIGPILSSVIVLVANASTLAKGLLLMLVYTLAFTLPFILLGLFTQKVLAFFRQKRNVMRYTTIVGAVLMIIMGVLLLSGYFATA